MQTRGPIRDYSRYANATENRHLRPQNPGEITDAAVYIYRKILPTLAPLCLIPSLYITCFLIVFLQMLFPRLFETGYTSDTTLQVLEFGLFLVGGLTVGFVVAGLGLAKIATYAFALTESVLKDQDITKQELEKASRGLLFIRAYKTLLRSTWYVCGFFFISLIPLFIGGLLLNVTSENNQLPGFIAVYSVIVIPIGIIAMMMRLGVGVGSISVALAEGKSPKESLARAKYLFGSKTRPYPKSNPAMTGSFTAGFLYLILRLGYMGVDSMIGMSQGIREAITQPVLKIAVDVALTMIPEFLILWLATPFIAITSSFYYFQRRIAVEGMDIKSLYEKLPANRR